MKEQHSSDTIGRVILLKTLTLVVPLLGALTEANLSEHPINFILLGKWFILSAVGFRLCIAGLRGLTLPALRAQRFRNNDEALYFPSPTATIVRLLIGICAVVSYSIPGWRIPVACISAAYFLFNGIRQIKQGPEGILDWVGVITDFVVFAALGFWVFWPDIF